jgi:hypothetical protein
MTIYIYSIYEQSSDNYYYFERKIRQKYTLTQILLVCNIYNINRVRYDNPKIRWSRIADLYYAFEPPNEFILK